MMRNLVIITVVGLLLAIVGIGGALALGGRDLAGPGWTWVITDDKAGDDSFSIERGSVSPDVTRTLDWTGGRNLSVDLPGEVIYLQGAEASVVVSGPQTLVERVRLSDGRLSLVEANKGQRGYIRWNRTGVRVWSETEGLTITVTAPDVNSFNVTGDSRLKLRGYDQSSLDLILSSDARVEAQGRTDVVSVDASGYGDADLDALIVSKAVLTLSGNSEAEVGPTAEAKADVSGNARVTLTRRPAKLEQTLTGDGQIEQD